MTVQAPADPRTNGKRRPVRIEISQADVVGEFMDLETLASEAIAANGYSLQTVLRLPPGTWRTEMQAAHIDTHDRLTRLLNAARLAAGRYDARPIAGA